MAPGTVGSIPTATKHRFRLNSLYDPDQTGTGEQPYYYDQLTAIYTKYIVRSCTVELTYNNPTTSGLWVGYSIHSNTTNNDDPSGKTLGDIMSRPNFVCMQIPETGEQQRSLRVTVPMHSVLGLSQAQYLSVTDQYGAAYNANPLAEIYMDLFILDPDSLVSPQYVRVAGRLIFDAQLFDYAAPSGS